MLAKILEQIDTIADAKGVAKMELLRVYDSDLLRRVFLYALDPYRMYRIKKLDLTLKPLEFNSWEDPKELFRTLDALAEYKLPEGTSRQTECEFVCEKYHVPPELLHRILNKDLRCGLAATSVNKVWPNLIPEFKVALAKEYEGEEDTDGFVSIKYDGLRCIALCDEVGDIKFYTRNGLEIVSAEHIKEPLSKMLSPLETLGLPCMLDGELMKSTGHFQDSSGSIRSKSKQDTSLVFKIFDWLPLQEFKNRQGTMSQETRINYLHNWAGFIYQSISNKLNYHSITDKPQELPFDIVGHVRVRSNSEVQKAYKVARDNLHEGLIWKDPKATYQFRRSNFWLKLKDIKSVDCKVTGTEPGAGKYAGMIGALIVDFEGKVNRVGSGLDDKQRALDPAEFIGCMAEIFYHEKTKDGNMRHARLIQMRPDLD